ncbi:protein translocase SEC61 complex subunit gamma [Candidatus Micrarchaeota archaeon CG10_big_fil_rev_8_21_14_0_10_45_29]|nr:MAG: protein translocase SEC61 complex subunit gamma [Candidatus Micrarchaeota archaeon CG10_big_fil_rev_8_21_14_0_10_45_29]
MDINTEIRKMIRVLRVSTRPRKKEFELMAKVTLAGVIIIGAIGVIISAVFSFIDKV